MKFEINNTTPLVSIALCTYNGEKYLRPQLDSLLAQTYTNIEIVISDDVSSDNTVALLQEYAAVHSNINVYKNTTNLGYNKNFETTIARCKGEFIAICDQDDVWDKVKIETMLKQWNKTAGLIYCSSKKIKSVAEIQENIKPVTKGYSGAGAAALACVNTVEGHTIIFHRALIGNILPFPGGVYYDWWMGAAAACNGGVQWVPEVLVWRRIHDANAYEQQQQSIQEKNKEWEKHLTAFLTIKNIDNGSKVFIEQCLALLHKPAGEKEWYQLIYKNRNTFFYYKKGIMSFWSKIKNSKKLAARLSTGI